MTKFKIEQIEYPRTQISKKSKKALQPLKNK